MNLSEVENKLSHFIHMKFLSRFSISPLQQTL